MATEKQTKEFLSYVVYCMPKDAKQDFIEKCLRKIFLKNLVRDASTYLGYKRICYKQLANYIYLNMNKSSDI